MVRRRGTQRSREALARASDGRLGELRSIDILLGHGGHPRSAESWKLDPARAGGGVLLDPGVHLFDLVLCVSRAARLEHVSATRGFWPTGVDGGYSCLARRSGYS